MTLLSVQHLVKRFGAHTAVHDVSIDVEAGEVVAIIGPNGAGKSTCFNTINGQYRPDGGRVLLDGADIGGLGPERVWRRGVGRTFQVTATAPSLTVLENVQMALLSAHRRTTVWWRSARALFRDEALALLEAVGMAQDAGRACGVLAYSALKQVELAIALANRPRLLLMDEPAAGMAPAERGALMRLVVTLARRERIGVLFTEHDIDVVFGCADRILVLHRGRMLAMGTPDEIREDPQVRGVYLGAHPMPDEAVSLRAGAQEVS